MSQLLSKMFKLVEGLKRSKKSAFAVMPTSRPLDTSTQPDQDAVGVLPVPTAALPLSERLTLP